jgi:hypothetical protein
MYQVDLHPLQVLTQAHISLALDEQKAVRPQRSVSRLSELRPEAAQKQYLFATVSLPSKPIF